MRIIDFFDNGAALYPESRAFVDGDEVLTYRQAERLSHHIASAIRGHGHSKGTKVGILAPNSNVAFVALLGLFRSESVWLPINPRNPAAVNIDLLDRFGGELLFYHPVYEKEAQQIREEVPGIREIVCLEHSDSEAQMTDWIRDFQQIFTMEPEDPEGLMAIFPTGGTTGKSKGVMLVHRVLETMFANFFAHFDYHDNTRHLVVAPMTHTAGVLGCLHFPRGGSNHMMTVVDPEAIMKAIQDQGITHLFLPPTVLYMMLAHPNVRDYNYSSLSHFLIGAAPSSLEKLKEAIDVFGPVMTEAFGQTEAPCIVCAKAPWDFIDEEGNINEARLRSVGRPAVFNQVALLDDEGNVVTAGDAGEICIKGRLVMPGYFRNPEETAKVSEFGWHHTGDIGIMDKDGFVTIVDRMKDMIITGGFNVYPNEIEQVLNAHPQVQDCAVFGIPDEKWGESVKAVVQLKSGAEASQAELIDMVKKELGSVKAPKSVDIMSDLPRSPVGKVLKTELRKQYWKDAERAVN
jgi:acyl-CoA synthetase (AMP-forming)/AMP-acid ligase II